MAAIVLTDAWRRQAGIIAQMLRDRKQAVVWATTTGASVATIINEIVLPIFYRRPQDARHPTTDRIPRRSTRTDRRFALFPITCRDPVQEIAAQSSTREAPTTSTTASWLATSAASLVKAS